MKLSKKQKEIVSKIISCEVYDISTYLKVFHNHHTEKYDIEVLRKKYELDEADKTYKVIKKGFSLWTTSRVDGIIPMNLPTPRIAIPENEYEHQKAKFIKETPKIAYENDGKKYEYDFSEGVEVISNFDDLIDFLTLWNYLRQESLILELDRQISKEDIAFFFQRVPKNKDVEKPKIKIEIDSRPFELKEGFSLDVLEKAPLRYAHDYSDITWIVNEEHLLMCHDFLDKKIVVTPALRTYAQKNFKTKEKISQQINLWIAIIALAVSVISVVIGNIMPLFQSKNTDDYLVSINQQLDSIENALTNHTDEITANFEEIKQAIDDLEVLIQDSKNTENHQQFEEIKQQLEKIIDAIESISEPPIN